MKLFKSARSAFTKAMREIGQLDNQEELAYYLLALEASGACNSMTAQKFEKVVRAATEKITDNRTLLLIALKTSSETIVSYVLPKLEIRGEGKRLDIFKLANTVGLQDWAIDGITDPYFLNEIKPTSKYQRQHIWFYTGSL